MRRLPISLIMLGLCASYVSAQDATGIPPKPNMREYQMLLTNSPFGKKKPEVVEAPPQVEVTSTYYLQGLSADDQGWVIRLGDKKDPSARKKVYSYKGAQDGISIVDVKQDVDNYKNTKVTIKQGGTNYTVSFDTAALQKTIQKSAAEAKQSAQKQANTNNGAPNPPMPNANQPQSEEYRQARENMMKEAAELRKMRENGNTGDDYQQRRKALMEQANDMRRQWRDNRTGQDANGRSSNEGSRRRRF